VQSRRYFLTKSQTRLIARNAQPNRRRTRSSQATVPADTFNRSRPELVFVTDPLHIAVYICESCLWQPPLTPILGACVTLRHSIGFEQESDLAVFSLGPRKTDLRLYLGAGFEALQITKIASFSPLWAPPSTRAAPFMEVGDNAELFLTVAANHPAADDNILHRFYN